VALNHSRWVQTRSLAEYENSEFSMRLWRPARLSSTVFSRLQVPHDSESNIVGHPRAKHQAMRGRGHKQAMTVIDSPRSPARALCAPDYGRTRGRARPSAGAARLSSRLW
jgi:hypothetical protein